MSPRNKQLIVDRIAELEPGQTTRASAMTSKHWLCFDSWR